MISSVMEKEVSKESLFDQPFALSIGPQRSGTSWLDRYLRSRGDICLPKAVKEIFFFDRHYDRGGEFYKTHFEPENKHKLIMEISTTSFDHEQAPKRVQELLGDNIRLLCPLRHPVIRSYSLYLHYLRYGIVQGSLKEACEQNPQILVSSRYAKHIQNWAETFGLINIHFVYQEVLESNQDAFVRNVCSALSIPYKEAPEQVSQRYNVTTYSKSGFIAGAAQKSADFLRKNKLYFLINLAKSAGLKSIIFGKENPDTGKNDIPVDDQKWLEDQLYTEVEDLEKLLGPIPAWQDKI